MDLTRIGSSVLHNIHTFATPYSLVYPSSVSGGLISTINLFTWLVRVLGMLLEYNVFLCLPVLSDGLILIWVVSLCLAALLDDQLRYGLCMTVACLTSNFANFISKSALLQEKTWKFTLCFLLLDGKDNDKNLNRSVAWLLEINVCKFF